MRFHPTHFGPRSPNIHCNDRDEMGGEIWLVVIAHDRGSDGSDEGKTIMMHSHGLLLVTTVTLHVLVAATTDDQKQNRTCQRQCW